MTTKSQLKKQLAEIHNELHRRADYEKASFYFPEKGRYARHKYRPHMKFFDAGNRCPIRAFIAGNRTGKSVCGAFEMRCHLTGKYPFWWTGLRFKDPIDALAVGLTNEETRDVIQVLLFGKFGDLGSGMLSKEEIVKVSSRAGVTNSIGYAVIKHVSGKYSTLTLKSCQQGRETFQGTKFKFAWIDEEPADRGIYSEILTRLIGHGDALDGTDIGPKFGCICTFTPLKGITDIVLGFMPDGSMPEGGVNPDNPNRFIVAATWEDAPHLTEEEKEVLRGEYTEYEMDARSKGLPCLGSGAVYPVAESFIARSRFKIPSYWPKAYALDYGWNCTAALWGAKDPDTGVLYLYSEYYVGKKEPSIHASGIRSHGDWLYGVADAFGREGTSGLMMLDILRNEGLNLYPVVKGPNSVESGVQRVLNMLSSGQIKVMEDLKEFLKEYRIYRREDDARGIPNIVKKNDHLMDCMRYLVNHFDEIAMSEDDYEQMLEEEYNDNLYGPGGGNPVTGY